MPSASPLDDPQIALGDQHAELAGLLAGLTREQWDAPTRCTGWTVSDVVLHLAQSDELAIASLEDRFVEAVSAAAPTGVSQQSGLAGSVDDWAAASVAAQRGAPPAEVHQRWRQSATDMRQAMADADPHRRVQWVGGTLSVTTLATTRLSEAWIHGGDVAEAVGVELDRSERLRHVARLAWRTLPYAFARSGRELGGTVAFELSGPEGDDWHFAPDGEALTVIRGDGIELCEVAAQRRAAATTSLQGDGPDAAAVLVLVRTYA
jgi:uncharacterized protein (TIGR03084 family)